MAGQQSHDIVRMTVDRFKARATQYAKGIADRMGPPAAGQKLTQDEVVKFWNFSPRPDPLTAYQQLVGQGMPPRQALDQVHPYRSKLIQAPTTREQIAKAESIKKMAEGQSSG